MKNIIRFLIVITLALASCNNPSQKIKNAGNKPEVVEDPQQEFKKLNDFLYTFEEPIQTFTVATQQLIKVKGKQGTIISIDPADLELESGQAIGKEVILKLKEIQNKEQLWRANAQTISDGQLLVSGGAYSITVTAKEQKVKLKEGKTYTVKFPKLSKKEMALYYGQRDSAGNMNWKLTDKKFAVAKPKIETPKKRYVALFTAYQDTILIPMDNLSEKQKKEYDREERVYKPIALNSFGWMNCDRLYDLQISRANLRYNITNDSKEVNYAKIYLIFKDVNSMAQSSYFVMDGKTIQTNFNQIPVGLKVRFLAVCYQHGKIYATLTKTREVAKDQNENLTLKAMSEREFNDLLKELR